MQDITVQGLIATTPRHLKTQEGLEITSFRLASSERKWDTKLNRWADGETNWYTITAFKQLAVNTHASVNKGDRIIVQGNLRIRDWDNSERAGTSVEIEATSIGHDLSWGNSVFTRTVLVKDTEEPEHNKIAQELAKTKEQLTELRELLGELSEGRA